MLSDGSLTLCHAILILSYPTHPALSPPNLSSASHTSSLSPHTSSRATHTHTPFTTTLTHPSPKPGSPSPDNHLQRPYPNCYYSHSYSDSRSSSLSYPLMDARWESCLLPVCRDFPESLLSETSGCVVAILGTELVSFFGRREMENTMKLNRVFCECEQVGVIKNGN